MATATRPHALLIPYPSSGHINPTLHLARLLHSAGVLVTFVNTENNHAILLARGHDVTEEDGFRYETIPDGLVPSERAAEDEYSMALLRSVRAHCGEPLRELILRLNAQPVTCVVADELRAGRGRGTGPPGLHAVGHQRVRARLHPGRDGAQAPRPRSTQRYGKKPHEHLSPSKMCSYILFLSTMHIFHLEEKELQETTPST
jgi:hypothetical protein